MLHKRLYQETSPIAQIRLFLLSEHCFLLHLGVLYTTFPLYIFRGLFIVDLFTLDVQDVFGASLELEKLVDWE